MIVVVGEALVDLVAHDEEHLTSHLGGGPFNTARGVARLDVPVAYHGRISTDRFGTQLRASLADAGVDLNAVVATTEPTSLAMAELNDAGAATYCFYFDGTSVPGLSYGDSQAVLPTDISALHLGTLGLMVEPLATTSELLAQDAHGTALVFVDPNIRPTVIADRAAYMARLERVLAHTDVVKVSDDDLGWMYPDDLEAAAVRRILELGPKIVFLTRGGEGVDVVSAESHIHIAPVTVEVADTIGAGDSFSAGVLAWWHHNGQPSLTTATNAIAAATYAAKVAAITVAHDGAYSPTAAEVASSL